VWQRYGIVCGVVVKAIYHQPCPPASFSPTITSCHSFIDHHHATITSPIEMALSHCFARHRTDITSITALMNDE